jgi:diguanylate cyclase (GGDEF)-like protein
VVDVEAGLTRGQTWLPSKMTGRLRVVREGDQLTAIEGDETLATLDLGSGRLSLDLSAISRLDQLIQVTHAMAGHPETVAARPGWDSPAVGLLGLLDRNAVLATLDDRLTGAIATPAPRGAFAFVDLDSLKYINDRMGHRVGDQVIEAIAGRLRRIAGDAVIGRLGGDEFVLVFDGVTPHQAAQMLAGASCDAMGPIVTEGGEIPVTFSAGVTDLYGSSVDEVLSRADATLYQAKRAGRDQIRVYGDGTAAFIGERHDLFVTVEALQALNKQLAHQAGTDALTGLPNRRAMDDAFAASDHIRAQSGQSDRVLFLDLDRFSSFNHARGQEAGDHALRTVARLLRQNLRDGDTCFRRGGEEFVVMLPNTSHDDALAVAERLRAAVEAVSLPHGGHPDCPTLTITVVVAAVHARAGDGVERASLAAFRAKDSGVRNCVLTPEDAD